MEERARRRTSAGAFAAFALATTLLARHSAAEDARAPVAAPKLVDAALQRRIDDAIENSVRWLRESVRDDGSLPPNGLTRAGTYDIGLAALAGYAMRHGGVDCADPRLTRVREFVARGVAAHVPADDGSTSDLDVYSAGLAIAFLLESGSAPDDALVVRTVRRLEDSWAETGWWGYALVRPSRPPTRRPGAASQTGARSQQGGNVSTTLYAVFGLHAAARHGIAVDARGLDRFIASLGDRQMRDGGFLYDDAASPQSAGARSYYGAASNAAAAFLLAGDATRRWKTPGDARTEPVVRDALPYLAAKFGPDRWGKPAAPPIQAAGGQLVYRMSDGVTPLCAEDTYNLYATERIGMLLDTDALGAVRWYESGANWLLGAQRIDGSWAPEDAPDYPRAATTAFGLLFLARSVRPAGQAATPRDAGPVTGAGPGEFSFDGAPGLPRLEWYDLFHRAMARVETLGGEARARFVGRLALLGPRVVRALVFELDSESRDRRRAARDALVALTGDDVGFDPDGDAKTRAKGALAWRRWLDRFEPFLVLEDGAIVTKPAPASPK